MFGKKNEIVSLSLTFLFSSFIFFPHLLFLIPSPLSPLIHSCHLPLVYRLSRWWLRLVRLHPYASIWPGASVLCPTIVARRGILRRAPCPDQGPEGKPFFLLPWRRTPLENTNRIWSGMEVWNQGPRLCLVGEVMERLREPLSNQAEIGIEWLSFKDACFL